MLLCFSAESGLCLNINKCERLPITQCQHTCLHGIPVKSQGTYLGVVITKAEDERCNLKDFAQHIRRNVQFSLL